MAKRRSGKYGRPTPGKEALHKQFMLAPDTKTFVLSVGQDAHLESYWHYRQPAEATRQLSELGLVGMSAPNFSFFTNAPKTEILINRRRSVMVAEELSNAGIGIALHLNALTQHDWFVWETMLRDRPHLRHVVKEFQTGLGNKLPGRKAVDSLARLQDRLKRPLHPILVGGGQFIGLAASHFDRLTLVDSEPFMRTAYRRAIVLKPDGRLQHVAHPTEPTEPLDSLLLRNLETYQSWVESQIAAKSYIDKRAGYITTVRGSSRARTPQVVSAGLNLLDLLHEQLI